jgi:hypothetical protein
VARNKTDRTGEKVVGFEERRKLAESLGCAFEECSAKTRRNGDKGGL